MALEKYHHHHHKEENGGKALTKDKHKRREHQLSLWDPLECNPFNSLGTFWQGPMSLFSSFCMPGTLVDWKETVENHIFKADIPGLTTEDVKVTVEDGHTLQILGHRRPDLDDGGTWRRVERQENTFRRRFQLPPDARVDTMKIKVENGVLTVYVPKDKKHKTPPRTSKEIPIQWE